MWIISYHINDKKSKDKKSHFAHWACQCLDQRKKPISRIHFNCFYHFRCLKSTRLWEQNPMMAIVLRRPKACLRHLDRYRRHPQHSMIQRSCYHYTVNRRIDVIHICTTLTVAKWISVDKHLRQSTCNRLKRHHLSQKASTSYTYPAKSYDNTATALRVQTP